jgi:hypothetical protein
MNNENRKITKALYITLSLLFLVFLIGNEFFWRYDSKLDSMIYAKLRDSQKNQRTLVIHEQSDSQVDTVNREYKDIQHGKTNIQLWIDGSRDTIHLLLQGKYISEARPLHITSDSSTQIILVPNTIQGLPSGSNMVLYLKNDSSLSLLEFSGFIADLEKNGNEAVNIPSKGGWVRLGANTGDWIPAQLKILNSIP